MNTAWLRATLCAGATLAGCSALPDGQLGAGEAALRGVGPEASGLAAGSGGSGAWYGLPAAGAAGGAAGAGGAAAPPVGVLPTCADPLQDPDRDGLCNADEALYKTDPNNPDSDGDALSDGLEVYGFTRGSEKLDLKALGANPLRPDIFLEIDYMAGFRPLDAAVQDVVAAFKAAPIKNRDGSTGIQLHVDISEQIKPEYTIPQMKEDPREELWRVKDGHFDSLRNIAYHYALFGDRYGAYGSSGSSADIGAVDLLVTLGGASWKTADQTKLRRNQAGTLMHELGHNLGLTHGGHESAGGVSHTSYKPHYLSIMNYSYQVSGVRQGTQDVFDYARAPVRALNESALEETAGFSVDKATPNPELARVSDPLVCSSAKTNAWGDVDCSAFRRVKGNAATGLDFNNWRGVQTGTVRADLDGDRLSTSRIAGLKDDWSNLDYRGGGVIGVVAKATGTPRRTVSLDEPVRCLAPAQVVLEEPQQPEDAPLPDEPQQPEDAPLPEEPQQPEDAPLPEEPQQPEDAPLPEEPQPEDAPLPEEPQPEDAPLPEEPWFPEEPLPEEPQPEDAPLPEEPQPEEPQEPSPWFPEETSPDSPQDDESSDEDPWLPEEPSSEDPEAP
jgi:hypothetical protein